MCQVRGQVLTSGPIIRGWEEWGVGAGLRLSFQEERSKGYDIPSGQLPRSYVARVKGMLII